MRNPTALAVILAILIGASGCSRGMPTADAQACFLMEGSGTEARTDFDQHVGLAQKKLEGSSSTELVDAADELATVDESERAAKVAEFMSLCDHLGYEPPEG